MMETKKCAILGTYFPMFKMVTTLDMDWVSYDVYKKTTLELKKGLVTTQEIKDAINKKEKLKKVLNKLILTIRKWAGIIVVKETTALEYYIDLEEDYCNKELKKSSSLLTTDEQIAIMNWGIKTLKDFGSNKFLLKDVGGRKGIDITRTYITGKEVFNELR